MKLVYLLFSALFLTACSDKLVDEEETCSPSVCTQEFRSVAVHFKDSSGNPLVVKNFSAIIRRTGEQTISQAADTINFKGSYLVASDNDRFKLSSEGEIIDVSAVNPKTNQKKTAQFVVSGGKCACHIQKVSGSEEVVFN